MNQKIMHCPSTCRRFMRFTLNAGAWCCEGCGWVKELTKAEAKKFGAPARSSTPAKFTPAPKAKVSVRLPLDSCRTPGTYVGKRNGQHLVTLGDGKTYGFSRVYPALKTRG